MSALEPVCDRIDDELEADRFWKSAGIEEVLEGCCEAERLFFGAAIDDALEDIIELERLPMVAAMEEDLENTCGDGDISRLR